MPPSAPLLGGNGTDPTAQRTFRAKVYDMVEGSFDSAFEYLILALIFLQTLLLLVSTVPIDEDPECFGSGCERLGTRYETFFEVAEAVSVGVFSVEYILRLWSCTAAPEFVGKGALAARWSYGTRFFSVIDLVSILPYWISLLPMAGESPDFTTALRIFRLVRLFKADKYINAFSVLGEVLYENGSLLIATSFYAVLAWFLSAAALYYTERDNDQLGAHFQSIPLALFPTLLMLTGEFPISDFTAIGKVIAGFIAVVAVAIFAVPTGVLGSGFVKAIQAAQGQEFTVDA